MENISLQQDLSKLYKPITEAQKETKQSIVKELFPLREDVKALPGALTAAIAPPIYGPLASKYLTTGGPDANYDKVYGIHAKDGKLYIGNKEIKIKGDDIYVDGEKFLGTPGLWELIRFNKPNNSLISANDLQNYGKVLFLTSSIFHNNNPNDKRPKSNRGEMYKDYIKSIGMIEKIFNLAKK